LFTLSVGDEVSIVILARVIGCELWGMATWNMGIGVIFIALETVANVDADLNGFCLMKRAADAKSVDVRRVVAVRGGCSRRRGSMNRPPANSRRGKIPCQSPPLRYDSKLYLSSREPYKCTAFVSSKGRSFSNYQN
jgi:hypothetical protein